MMNRSFNLGLKEGVKLANRWLPMDALEKVVDQKVQLVLVDRYSLKDADGPRYRIIMSYWTKDISFDREGDYHWSGVSSHWEAVAFQEVSPLPDDFEKGLCYV